MLEDVQEADWSPDGSELLAVHEVSGRNRLEYPIGTTLYETSGWISSPRVSPDGKWVAFLDHGVRWDNGGWVTVVGTDGSGRRRLTEHFSASEGLIWRPGGDEIWFTANVGVFARGVRAVTLEGKQRIIYRQASALTLFDLLPDGRALMGSTNQRREIRFGTAEEERDLSWLDWSLSTFLSRDGKTILINEQWDGSQEGYSIYLRDTDGTPPVHIGEGITMCLSPTGKWLVARVG